MADLKTGEKRKSVESADTAKEKQNEVVLLPHVKKMKSIFAKQDLVIVVEGHELHVDKTELMEKSPVFKAMLTSDFKEEKSGRINLPKQKLEDFLIFLRCTLSSVGDGINVSTAWTIIPIAHEYQVETTLSQAELILSVECARLGIDKQSSEDIIKGILFAEKYDLKKFMQSLIECASKKMFYYFSKANGFKDISQKTLFVIAMKRWSDNVNPTDGTVINVNFNDGTLTNIIPKPQGTCNSFFSNTSNSVSNVPKRVL